jgi:hypothetical protein
VEKRENPIVNRLNKTKTEKFPDLKEEKEERLKELGRRDRDAQQIRVSLSSFQHPSYCTPVAVPCLEYCHPRPLPVLIPPQSIYFLRFHVPGRCTPCSTLPKPCTFSANIS